MAWYVHQNNSVGILGREVGLREEGVRAGGAV